MSKFTKGIKAIGHIIDDAGLKEPGAWAYITILAAATAAALTILL